MAASRPEQVIDRGNEATEPKGDLVKRGTSWLGVVIAVASVVGIALALLGYGVALAVQSVFGIPHATVFNSSLDLFNLGGWAIGQGLLHIGSWNTSAFYRDIWLSAWPILRSVWLIALFVGVTFLFLLGVRWCATRSLSNGRAQKARLQLRALILEKPWLERVIVAALVSIVTLATAPMVLVAVLAAMICMCGLLGLVPILGYWAGTAHIKDWVVEPTICMPKANRIEQLLHPRSVAVPGDKAHRAADCISVTRADGKIEVGRLVFATTGAVVLYNPAKNTVKRVPTDGSLIEPVDTLE